MILWRDAKLVQQWQDNAVSESDIIRYMLMSSLAITLGYYLPREMSQFVWVNRIEMIFMLLLSIGGVWWTFLKNGAENGRQFLSKFITLSIPIGIQLFCLSILLSFIYGEGIGLVLAKWKVSSRLLFGADLGFLSLGLGIEMAYFYRIGNRLSQIQSTITGEKDV